MQLSYELCWLITIRSACVTCTGPAHFRRANLHIVYRPNWSKRAIYTCRVGQCIKKRWRYMAIAMNFWNLEALNAISRSQFRTGDDFSKVNIPSVPETPQTFKYVLWFLVFFNGNFFGWGDTCPPPPPLPPPLPPTSYGHEVEVHKRGTSRSDTVRKFHEHAKVHYSHEEPCWTYSELKVEDTKSRQKTMTVLP